MYFYLALDLPLGQYPIDLIELCNSKGTTLIGIKKWKPDKQVEPTNNFICTICTICTIRTSKQDISSQSVAWRNTSTAIVFLYIVFDYKLRQ